MNTPNPSQTNNPLAVTSASGLMADVRAFAREHLSAAMVPSRFVILEQLPKLPNGKVDRKRLPLPQAEAEQDEDFDPPRTPTELRIAEIWRDLLHLDRIGVRDNFFDRGGDSLSAVQMAAKVREAFGVKLDLQRLFKQPSITGVVRMLEGHAEVAPSGGVQNLTDAELIAEAELPTDVAPEAGTLPPTPAPYRRILLTGATGYTGAFLLRELLERSTADILVLVRAHDAEQALARVRGNMQRYGLWREGYALRLQAVVGDVGKPYLGVSQAAYRQLAVGAEMIIHNAAVSNYAMPYRHLKATNVLGTLEVLRLACLQRIKPVHYVSTLAVFAGVDGEACHQEIEVTEPNGLAGGYRQTKWVSERLLAQARARGIPGNIYRPGQITGAQDSGACAPDTYLNAAIKGCIQLGAELDFDVTLEITPVDFCAQALAHIALAGETLNTQFNLLTTRPLPWRDAVDMLRTYGYRLRSLPYADWYRELAAALERGEENEMSRFFPLFGADAPSADAGDAGSKPDFDATNLRAALSGSGITCRPLDQALMNAYLDYFVSSGFLPHP
ncbi:thioester reductase domain-containing protein [Endothiovibrio diazotrophicus]